MSILPCLTFMLCLNLCPADMQPACSVAGFSEQADQGPGRDVYHMNRDWLYHKGDVKGGERPGLDTRSWAPVNLPHGLEILPEEASGGVNYQGVAWYRKSFTAPQELEGKRVTLYFEGIMGRSKIWLNGEEVGEHAGGYLPVVLDVSKAIKPGKDNLLCVRADNSDDPAYPPGKPQKDLDFCYFGGIYRDAYLLATNKVHITDANESDTVAGGGVFFRTLAFDPKSRKAEAMVKVQVANETDQERKLIVNAFFTYPGDTELNSAEKKLTLAPHAKGDVELPVSFRKARPWSPQDPHLYTLAVCVYEQADKKKPVTLLDQRALKVGIRTIKLDDKGFTLNGKPYPGKLIGGNRHQDFAQLGNAVPNNLQWRDAVKLHKAGIKVVRCAHYPMDPAFMDACDALGIFVIVPTPGWQFWREGSFGELVCNDIRQMIRRDRNRPSVLMWEPILNETRYPAAFAKKARDTVHEEYPGPGCYAACDTTAPGAEHFDVLYTHPLEAGTPAPAAGKACFTREFGDNVDDWSSHNSPSRVSRKWGEIPMLIQAQNYLKPPFKLTSWDSLCKAPAYHFGGCLWNPFDHQRGYHPDPFYGGIMDAFRQPKTSFFAFRSQMDAGNAEKGEMPPMVHIAHECTPFSPADVTVYTNCDEVRLSVNGKESVDRKVGRESPGIPHPPVLFEKAWDFMEGKNLSRSGKGKQAGIIAEGLMNGKVVARHEVKPARRPSRIILQLDDEGVAPMADGSDIVTVIASVTDSNGTVKRLSNESITFKVEGPAEIIGATQPREISWGTVPILLRMGTTPGAVVVTASAQLPGISKPVAGMLEFEILPDRRKSITGAGGAASSRPGQDRTAEPTKAPE